MKLLVLLLAILSASVYAYDNPPMNQIGELGSYAYDDEYLLSNMVYAVNERASALYKNYSVVTNCAGTNIVHNYWVDKIPIESWLVAWGTNTFEVEYTVTNTFNGETITNTFTNFYLGFEYNQGSEPEGYAWSSNFNPQVIRHINEAGSFRGFTYRRDENVYTNILLRVVSNDFTDVSGIRMTANKPYTPCESNYFFNLASDNFYKQSVFSKTIELMPYYVGVDVDQFTNYPFWIFAEWPPYTPHVFEEAGPDLSITPGKNFYNGRDWVRAPLCNEFGDVYYPCWRYYSTPEWRKLSANSLTTTKDWLGLLDYINKYSEQTNNLPFALLGSNINEKQYFFSSTGGDVFVNGWEVNQLTNLSAYQSISSPFVLATNNPSTNYFFESQPPSHVISVYDTNNIAQYTKINNAMPMFQVDYRVTQTVPAGTPIYGDCSECWTIEDWDEFIACLNECYENPASTNEKTYRIIRPVYNEYGMKDLLAQRIDIYPTNTIEAFLQTKTSYTNWIEFDAYDAIPVTNKMGQFVITTNSVNVNVNIVVNEFRIDQESVTQIVQKGESEAVNFYEIPGEYTDDEPVSMSWTGGWYKSTFFPAYTAYTSYYETVTNIINGEEVVTNYWEPNYDLTLRHYAYATNVMPERIGLAPSDRPFYFDYDNDIYAFLWNALKQMTKTRPASFVYNPDIGVISPFSSGTNYFYGLAGTIVNEYSYTDNYRGRGEAYETNFITKNSKFYEIILSELKNEIFLENETNRFANIQKYQDAVNFALEVTASYRKNILTRNFYSSPMLPEDFVAGQYWNIDTSISASTNYVNYDFYVMKDPELTGTLTAYSSLEYDKTPSFWSAESVQNCRRRQNISYYAFLCFPECDTWDDYFEVIQDEEVFEDIGQIFYELSERDSDRVNFVYAAPIPLVDNIVGYDKTEVLPVAEITTRNGTVLKCQEYAVGYSEYRGGERIKEYLDLFWEWDFIYAVDNESEAE